MFENLSENELINLSWFVVGFIACILLSFTKWRKWESFPSALLVSFFVPPLSLIFFQAIIKGNIRQKDFLYTIETGKCKLCGEKAIIEAEVGTSRGSIDNIFTSINCNCRVHENRWNHFDKEYKIYNKLIKHKKYKNIKWIKG